MYRQSIESMVQVKSRKRLESGRLTCFKQTDSIYTDLHCFGHVAQHRDSRYNKCSCRRHSAYKLVEEIVLNMKILNNINMTSDIQRSMDGRSLKYIYIYTERFFFSLSSALARLARNKFCLQFMYSCSIRINANYIYLVVLMDRERDMIL